MPELESVESRFDRDWGQIADDRKVRGLDNQSNERQARLYVNAETGESATGKSHPTVDALFD